MEDTPSSAKRILQGCFWMALEIVALFQTGYIHPDEFFQNPEIMAGDIFNVTHFRAWEFEPANSLRTITIPYLTTGIPFDLTYAVSRYLRVSVPSYFMIVISRSVLFFLRTPLRWFLPELTVNGGSRRRSRALDLCFRTSYLEFIFLSRTFSNSVETFLFAWLLYLVLKSVVYREMDGTTAAKWIAIVSAAGIFNRPTFLAFGIVPWLMVLFNYKVKNLVRGVLAGLLTCAVFITVDSLYFGRFVVTPYQFFLYNINPKNNEAHGLHPRYFHLLVSMPQLFGPMLLAILYPSVRRKLASEESYFLLPIILVPLFLISMIPHHEPRFILPLMIPMYLLLAEAVWECVPLRLLWILFNLVAGLFFGFVHQGGVIPSLSTVRYTLETQPEVHVAYYKTYIPPQYPLFLPRNESERFVNLGMSDHVEYADVASHLEKETLERTVYLLMPATIDVKEVSRPGHRAYLWKKFCPHWSFEAQPDYATLRERPEQLCLNMWRFNPSKVLPDKL